MKEGCMGISVIVPVTQVIRLDRLPAKNRTKSVNAAIDLYLDVQEGPVGSNCYGVDCDYFREKLRTLIRDIGSYGPEGLSRAFARLSVTAGGVIDEKV
jgi:hypothetical protein